MPLLFIIHIKFYDYSKYLYGQSDWVWCLANKSNYHIRNNVDYARSSRTVDVPTKLRNGSWTVDRLPLRKGIFPGRLLRFYCSKYKLFDSDRGWGPPLGNWCDARRRHSPFICRVSQGDACNKAHVCFVWLPSSIPETQHRTTSLTSVLVCVVIRRRKAHLFWLESITFYDILSSLSLFVQLTRSTRPHLGRIDGSDCMLNSKGRSWWSHLAVKCKIFSPLPPHTRLCQAHL